MSSNSLPGPNPVVETSSGKVKGFNEPGVAAFLGIPYGASTSGANRFRPPVKREPWTGIRNCLSYGHSCPQAGTGVIENDEGGRNSDEDAFLLYRTNGWIRGEDCLCLNVWTPSTGSSSRKRPVMVYMHGGGYTGGSGNDLLRNSRKTDSLRLVEIREFLQYLEPRRSGLCALVLQRREPRQEP